jgi:hypothetical protein
MSELSKNQLFSRRGFMRRTIGTATIAGAGAGLVTLPGSASSAESRAANPWAYDDSQYRRTDPKLIRYQETSRFQVAQSSPRCLCLTRDEHLLVGAGKSVTEYALDGTKVSQFAVGSEIRCLAASKDGLIYVGLRDHIEIYDGKGQRRGTWESPGKKAYLTGVAVGDSDVFVADAGQRVVIRYDLSGNIKGRIGEKRKDGKATGFIVPSPFFDVEIAADGLLRVTNPGRHCVEAYTFGGDMEFSWGKAGAGIESFCGCCNPINLALLRDGTVITFEKGIPRVKVFSSQGSFEGVVAGAESCVENAKACGPDDCTLGGLDGVGDSKGRIHILDLVAGNVRTMERKSQEA